MYKQLNSKSSENKATYPIKEYFIDLLAFDNKNDCFKLNGNPKNECLKR